MPQSQIDISLFHDKVITKYNVYNGLFLDLPYSREENIGVVIPLLIAHVSKGLKNQAHPVAIMNDFFSSHYQFRDEESRIDFMFKVIQYIERQVVLFDAVEDASFEELSNIEPSMGIPEFIQVASREGRKDEVLNKLKDFSARLVFTAHPTQFYPPQVLDIISELRSAIMSNDVINIDRLLRQLGLTSLLNSDKPTPLDEARNIIYYLRHIYYDVIGDIFNETKSLFPKEEFQNYGIIKIGFWPGGDRDGNPFVTHEITRQVANELRMTLMKCYYHDLKQLEKKLSFKKTRKPVSELKGKLYEAMFHSNTKLNVNEILATLENVKDIVSLEYHGIYTEDIQLLIDKVNIFKTHFAALDIRQDHSQHIHVMEVILQQKGFINSDIAELDQSKLTDILLNEAIELRPEDYDDPLVIETIKTIQIIPEIQGSNGHEGCHRYIISNSEDVNAVLFVYAMLRWCNGEVNLDIVPLFETMKGMQESGKIMQALFDLPAYKKHIENRDGFQTMMLGFSDGTKDGGYLKANWSIHQTKEKLTEICEANGINPIFFDGRGGPPARGGGKTHRFYASQGSTIANNEIQLTIQGQTITSIYGAPAQFKFNSEQLITAALSNELHGQHSEIDAESRALIDELAAISFEKYESLKHHPKFIDYLEQKSTLRYYGMANIGSRPGKRGKSEKLTLKDLRAISFVGSWNQLKQNVPGYFGIGTAIHQLKEEGRMEEVKGLFNKVKWFNALMLNSMMALSKSNFNLTSYMKDDKDFGAFWNVLYDEYILSKEMLLEISGYDALMQEEIISRESINMRENMVLPLLVIQQFALFKISEEDPQKEIYEKIVTRSLFGNINASRNSA